jgi:hypothetical protein
VDHWHSRRRPIVLARLQGAYRRRFLGRNLLLLSPAVLGRAQAQGIRLGRRPPLALTG